MTNRYHHGHQTHRETLYKFLALVGILLAYFAYLSWKFDAATGGFLAALTWSFLVLCSPIADGGFLIDFPVRLLFKVRMIYSEICVWLLAIGINVFALSVFPEVYDKTFLTILLKKILTTPWPYWGIVILSAIGTFLSIYFGDEMLDVFTHKERTSYHRHGFKWQVIAVITLFLLALAGYYQLIRSLGIELDKF